MHLPFNELPDKAQYILACYILRNAKDGEKWRKRYSNGHEVKKILATLQINAAYLCDRYKINPQFLTHAKE